MKLTAAFVPPTEGGFTAFVEEIPGAIAKGETIDGVRENLSVALRTVLEFNRELARRNESVDCRRETWGFAAL